MPVQVALPLAVGGAEAAGDSEGSRASLRGTMTAVAVLDAAAPASAVESALLADAALSLHARCVRLLADSGFVDLPLLFLLQPTGCHEGV